MRKIAPFISLMLFLFMSAACTDKKASDMPFPDTNKDIPVQNQAQSTDTVAVAPLRLSDFDTAEVVQLEAVNRKITHLNSLVIDGAILVFGGATPDGDTESPERNDVLMSRDGIHWRRLTNKLFTPPRNNYSVGCYKDSVVIVGGTSIRESGQLTRIVYQDAIHINYDTGDMKRIDVGSPRSIPAVIEYKEALFIIGGIVKNKKMDTAIRILDGEITDIAHIPGADSLGIPQAWVSGDSLYVTDRQGRFWESDDGLVWREIVYEDPLEYNQTELLPIGEPFFASKTNYTIIARDSEWYLIGGITAANLYYNSMTWNDVWRSGDWGRTWKRIAEPKDPPLPEGMYPPRQDAAGFVLNGKLVLGGGMDAAEYLSDFWSSEDGVRWESMK